MKNNLFNMVFREIVQNGKCELRITIDGRITVGELKKKIELLLSAFKPEQITLVKRLTKEEEKLIEMTPDEVAEWITPKHLLITYEGTKH